MNEPKPSESRMRFPSGSSGRRIEKVKANKGAAGVDGESIEEFERNLKGNLYKLWNRMSSGSYFPPPVRVVEIPKKDGRGAECSACPLWRTGSRRRSCELYSGAGGGADVPPRLLRLSARALGTGRSGGLPGAVLAEWTG